jgi:Holliday junction resolvase RusA-like endonuclease
MFKVLLPVATSVNKATRSVSAKERAIAASQNRKIFGRKKTDEYDAWIKEAGWMLKIARAPTIKGRYAMRITLPESCNLDIDNPIKATLDLFVKMGITEGDSKKHCRSIAVEWWDEVMEPIGDKMLVMIFPA